MTTQTTQMAGAIVLAESALEMLMDAVSELQDAGDTQGHQELSGLADSLSSAVEGIRQRKSAFEVGGAAPITNDNPSEA